MAKGINIEFVSDVRRFLSGTKDLGKSLDDVGDSLDDLSKDAQKTGDKIGESLEGAGDEAKDAGKKIGTELEDGADKAEDAAEKMERKFRDAFDDVSGKARKAGDDVGDDTKRGFGRAEQAAEGFRDEARQNFAETASSFDGSMDSIADMAQSTLGGLATAIPGAGIALAGLGAAAGVFYAQWAENAEKTEARISAMYDDMLESGNRFLSAQYVNEGISAIVNNDEDAIIDYARAQEIAAKTGLDLATVVRGYAGDADAAAQVSGSLTDAQAALEGQNSSTNVALNGMAQELATVTGNTATAAEKAELYTEAQVVSAEAARDFAIAQAGVGESVASASEKIAANNSTLADAEQRAVANDAALAELADELDGVNRSAVTAGRSGAALTKVQEGNYGAFIAAAEAAGYTADEARDLARDYGLIPSNVHTDITADAAVSQAEQDLNHAARDRRARIVAEYRAGISQYTSERASGGPVDQGSYLVGEHGPEVVTMGGRGTVTPNVNVQAGGKVSLDDSSLRRLALILDGHAAKRSVAAVADKARADKLAGRR